MNHFFKDMEKITICMGVAIISLGFLNMLDFTTVPLALVTGISISGFCLTTADFLSKLNEDYKFKTIKFLAEKSSWVLYLFATFSIICFPYLGMVKTLSENDLAKMSTVTSVIALGLVFVSIGYNNKREALKDAKEINNEYQELLTQYDHLIDAQSNVLRNIEQEKQRIGQFRQHISKQKEELNKENTNTPS